MIDFTSLAGPRPALLGFPHAVPHWSCVLIVRVIPCFIALAFTKFSAQSVILN